MSTLIALLNRHSHLTPDEIVAKIKNRGWIRLGTISQELYNSIINQQCALAQYRRDEWMLVQHPLNWAFWFDFNECHDYWQNFWVCLEKDFVDGNWPDRDA